MPYGQTYIVCAEKGVPINKYKSTYTYVSCDDKKQIAHV